MPLHLERITAARLAALPRDKTVFFYSMGVLEDHGPHLPLGLDLQESQRKCFLVAERLERELPGWTGVLMPGVPLSIDSNTSAIALTTRAHVGRDWLVDSSVALWKQGFLHFACWSGTMGPRQLTAIEEAGKILARRSRRLGARRATLISIGSGLLTREICMESLFFPDPAEHGGKRDISVALSLAPDTVDPAFRNLVIRKRDEIWSMRALKRFRGKISGVWGDPIQSSAAANPMDGKVILQQEIDRAFPKLKSHWQGTAKKNEFRSFYSYFPPNWSFFRAWMLAALIAGVLLIWTAFLLEGILLG